VYVKGEDNSVTDALSRTSFDAENMAGIPYPPDNNDLYGSVHDVFACANALTEPMTLPTIGTVASTLSISADNELLELIKAGYDEDPWCKRIREAKILPHGIENRGGLLYAGQRLIVPWNNTVCEGLFHLAHDVLGHFGFAKSYWSLWDSFYWPNMRRDLELVYVPMCADCQQNKATTKKPSGPLHPLPIPDQRGDSVTMDFIGPLLEDERYNCIVSFTDRLNSDIRIIPTRTDILVEDLAVIFLTSGTVKMGCCSRSFQIVTSCSSQSSGKRYTNSLA
jgi:hypothetical protein